MSFVEDYEMDPLTIDFLENNGFQYKIDTFKAQKINMANMDKLNEHDLASLFETIGERSHFRSALAQFVQERRLKESPFYVSRTDSADTLILNTSSCSSATSSIFSTPGRRKQKESTPVDDSLPIGLEEIDIKQVISDYQPDAKVLMRQSDEHTLFPESKKQLIANAIVHFALTNFYNELQGKSCAILSSLCEKLINAFPRERLDIYYRPAITDGKMKFRAMGKVMERYYNSNTKFRNSVGHKSPGDMYRLKRSEAGIEQGKRIVMSDLPDNEYSEEQYELCIEFLRHHQDNWAEVLKYWKESSVWRIKEIYNLKNGDDDPQTVNEIIQTWPILKHPNAYSLLSLDFCTMYSLDVSPLVVNFKLFKEKLKRLYRDEITNVKIKLQIENFIQEDDTVEGEDNVLLAYLPYFFKPKMLHSADVKHRVWKPTHVDMVDGFLSLVKTEEDVGLLKSNRKKRLGTYKEPVQPYVVAVGSDWGHVSKCHVIIDNIEYEITEPLKAIDVCFMGIHALAANYDRESQPAWLLLQLYFYRIHTKFDSQIKNTRVNMLIDELNKEMVQAEGNRPNKKICPTGKSNGNSSDEGDVDSPI